MWENKYRHIDLTWKLWVCANFTTGKEGSDYKGHSLSDTSFTELDTGLEWFICPYLSHINNTDSQRLVAQNSSVFIAFPPLKHDLQPVGIPLQEMWVLKKGSTTVQQRFGAYCCFVLHHFHQQQCDNASTHTLFDEISYFLSKQLLRATWTEKGFLEETKGKW